MSTDNDNNKRTQIMRQILERELRRRRRGLRAGEQVTIDSPGRIDPATIQIGVQSVRVDYFEHAGWCVVALGAQIDFEVVGDRELFSVVVEIAERMYRRGADLPPSKAPGHRDPLDVPDDELPSPFRRPPSKPRSKP